MAQELTVELDDIHELMFNQLKEDSGMEMDMEEWAEDTLQSVIYRAYQNHE